MTYLKGLALLNLERREEAIQCFDEILNDKFITEIPELNENVMYNKGIALLQKGKFYSAILQFDRILQNKKINLKSEVLFHKGLAYKYLGKKDELDNIIDKLKEEDLDENLRLKIENEL